VVKLLLAGDSVAKDAAVHTAWLLVKGNRSALHPDAEALGVPGEQLIAPLSAIIQAGAAKDKVRAGGAALGGAGQGRGWAGQGGCWRIGCEGRARGGRGGAAAGGRPLQ
jgi:hypothetical protein